MCTSTIKTVRKLYGLRVPTVNLSNFNSGDTSHDLVNATREALKRQFIEFAPEYEKRTDKIDLSLEAVLNYMVTRNAEYIFRICGVNIIYNDKIINVRFIIDGMDTRANHDTTILKEIMYVTFQEESVSVIHEIFKIGNTEYQEYVLTE